MISSELWWNYVPAGVSIKESILRQLTAGRCVLLNTSCLPWKEELLKNVQTDVELADAELNWNEINAEENIGNKPINYLGSFYGVDQIPVEEMIRQKIRNLHSCCWVKNIPENESQAWIQMAKDLFSGREKQNFRLVLELPSVTVRGIGKITVIDTHIERFDIYYFALSILANGKLGKNFKEYAATLCSELANGNVELCYTLCKNIDNVLRDPLSVCMESEADFQRKQLVCRAQTRSISPLIDIGRLKLISIFGARIEGILPQQDDYGTEIEDVNEVELRHLVYFSHSDLLNITPTEKDVLYSLYNARNAISHLNLLSYDEIQNLFRMLEDLL